MLYKTFIYASIMLIHQFDILESSFSSLLINQVLIISPSVKLWHV